MRLDPDYNAFAIRAHAAQESAGGRGLHMGRASADRIGRAVIAGAVLLVHLAVLWLLLQPVNYPIGGENEPDAAIAAIIEQARPRNLQFGPVSIHVKMTRLRVDLERLAPNIQDISVEQPKPPRQVSNLEAAASAPLPKSAKSGLDGEAAQSTGRSGGGNDLTLLERVIPEYPIESARRHEEGTVRVAMRVDEPGRVDKVMITRSSRFRRLDKAAVAAFRKWRFAPMPRGSSPTGKWIQTEQNFFVLRLRYSRLSDKAAEDVHVEPVEPAVVLPTPGSQKALSRFIDEVLGDRFRGGSDDVERTELEEMHAALRSWGAVNSIKFTGTAGSPDWTPYRTRLAAADRSAGSTVELKWDAFEVRQEHATTEWLIAVDRRGTIWSAQVSPPGRGR